MKFRRSEMVEERTGVGNLKSLWVHKSVENPIHPQDYVRTPAEDPSVTPSFSDVPQEMGETILEANFYGGDNKIIITLGSGLSENDSIGIIADDNTAHWTFITSVEDTTMPLIDANGDVVKDVNGDIVYAAESNGWTVTLHEPLYSKSSAGNAVFLPSINQESWV